MPPLLLLHGAGGGGWEWHVWARVLAADGYEVAMPDLHPRPALADTTLEDYLEQVRRACPAQPPVVIGASLGGLLAMALAASRRCAALVLVNPLPPAPEAADLPPREYGATVPWGRDASLEGTRRALPDASCAASAYAARRWRDESGRVLREARAGIFVAAPACPVLVVASDADDDVPPALSQALARRWSASLLRVPGSHVGPLLGRQAAACAAQVAAWLRASVRFTTD